MHPRSPAVTVFHQIAPLRQWVHLPRPPATHVIRGSTIPSRLVQNIEFHQGKLGCNQLFNALVSTCTYQFLVPHGSYSEDWFRHLWADPARCLTPRNQFLTQPPTLPAARCLHCRTRLLTQPAVHVSETGIPGSSAELPISCIFPQHAFFISTRCSLNHSFSLLYSSTLW